MCHLTRATQGNLLEETTTTPTSLAPPAINGFSGVTIEPDLNDVVPEMLHVQVLKDGGCVYVKNMPYGRVGAAEDRTLLNSSCFMFLNNADNINPRLLTALGAEAMRKNTTSVDDRIFFFQPEMR